MRFQGRLAELMVLIAPQVYRKYVTTDTKGEPVLFVKLQKALYGMLKSALLFYKKLLTDLVAKGFTVNPYDPCVVTKMIRGKQMTICWHVDDLKLSHRRKAEIKKIEHWLRSIYGNVTVSYGDKHTYLGMDLDYSEKGKCRITMPGYTREVIDAFPEVINGSAATPAADHLFQTREDGKKLPEEQATAFHRTTAQLLFLSGRARRDIQTAVAFLTTRVKNPDEDDWGKLKRVLRYLNGTIDMGLCLSVENMGLVRWYVDASYATHDDCKGHTGAMMTLGQGAAISMSRKQKTNARSSTEAELIGVYDALPSILHTRYFLEAMGYNVKHNVIYQDNKSSITLEKNGRTSSSKRTKHIKIRYFFIKDMIAQREVEVRHCPTEEMWSDILTKPKQGKDFIMMRSKLLGWEARLDAPGDAAEQTRTQRNSVTRRDQPLLSPRGCVGPEIPKVRTKVSKLHVEGNESFSRRKLLVEPGRRIFMLTERRVVPASE
jgi:histone deacetylase 1/2